MNDKSDNTTESNSTLADADTPQNELTKQTDAGSIAPKPKKNANQVVYSHGEELANIITHGAGAILAVIASVLLIVKVSLWGNGALPIVAVSLYSLSMIGLYLMSSLYHAQKFGTTSRAVFRKLDHCSVALLIAGTYAPYMLIGLCVLGQGNYDFVWGIIIASVVLAMAALVIVFNAISPHKFRVFSLIAYVIMGWACIIRIGSVFNAIGGFNFAFLLAGGIAYTVGILFYRIKKIPWNHAIWHFFVLAGSILQFISIYGMIGM